VQALDRQVGAIPARLDRYAIAGRGGPQGEQEAGTDDENEQVEHDGQPVGERGEHGDSCGHATNFQELITIVAAGNAVCPVHDHASRYYARPDIRYLPIADAPIARWALVWRTAAETDLIRAFAQVVTDHGPLQL
jgi:hypothetical protein